MEEVANEMEDALHALQNDDGVDIWATDSDFVQDAKEKQGRCDEAHISAHPWALISIMPLVQFR